MWSLQTRQNALISPLDAVDDPGIERADDGFVVEVVLFEEVRDYVHELKRGVFYKLLGFKSNKQFNILKICR